MNVPQSDLDKVITNVQDLIVEADVSATQSSTDNSWYLSLGSDVRLHLLIDNNAFVLRQSDRGGDEDEFFVSTISDAMEKFLTYTLCRSLREDKDLPFLLVVPVPMTIEDVARGYTLLPNGDSWTLVEAATGNKFYGDYVDLIEFSYYAYLSPRELREACAAPAGKPPFFPYR